MLDKKIPEQIVKWVAAIIFIAFGLLGLYQTLPQDFLTIPVLLANLAITIALVYLVSRRGKKS